MKNYSTAEIPNFEFQEGEKEGFECNYESLHLTSLITTSNMVLFTKENRIKKFTSIDDILKEYFEERLAFYEKRMDFLMKSLKQKKLILSNRANFILEVDEKKIVLFQKAEEEIIRVLESKQYSKVDDSFDYLLSMEVRQFEKKNYNKLTNDILTIQKDISNLKKLSPRELWRNELQELLSLYEKSSK